MPDWLSFIIILAWPVASGGLFCIFFKRFKTVGATPAPLRVLVGNALALIFFASAAFFLAECYHRFLQDTTDSFGYTKSSQRWFKRHFKTNNAAARDNIDYEKRIALSRRRITFIGDSFTAGHGVKDVEDRFGNLIRRAFPEVEVHVLAQTAMETGGELAAIRDLAGIGYQFDQVVLVYCLNDISDLLPEWAATLARVRLECSHPGWLVKNSYFANTLYYHYMAKRDPAVTNYFSCVRTAHEGAAWREQRERLIQLRRAVEAAGGHLSVVTFPFLHALGPNYEFHAAHEVLGQFWREQGVPHLDLLPAFQGIPAKELVVNSRDAHPNEYAHQLAAEAIARFLKQIAADGTKR
jgi:lysophospholipase L1-like esterase